MDTVDVVVIGLGPGGEEVAGKLAEAGLVVVGIEAELVGGECPYWGCIPSKMMIRAADSLAETDRVAALAGTSSATPNFSIVADRIRDEATDDWDDQVAVDRFISKGGHFIRGHATITGPHEVTVNGEVITTRNIVVAAGATPSTPPVPGLADTAFWTNRDAVKATTVPGSLVVVGGGAIGAELAQVFCRFGSQVTIMDSAPRLLSQEEPEAGAVLADVFENEGIRVHTGVKLTSVSQDRTGFIIETDQGEFRSDQVLVATGRRPHFSNLGLEALGIDTSKPELDVDQHMKLAPGVWAVGDVVGKGAFTHVAMYQAAIVINAILGESGPGADYRALPHVTFTDPEVGSVGLTQKQAEDQGLRIRIGTAQVPTTARGWIHKVGNEGFIKVIEDADRGVLVGATSMGPSGGEVLGALVVAIHGQVPVESLIHMMYAYPTFHRGIEDAIRDLHSP